MTGLFFLSPVKRALAILAAGNVALGALTFLVDWAIWRVRVSRGSGMGQVEVARMTAISLKGRKEEYFSEGTTLVGCSHALFPHGGDAPCWWLARDPEVTSRY